MVWHRLDGLAPAELSAKTEKVQTWNKINDQRFGDSSTSLSSFSFHSFFPSTLFKTEAAFPPPIAFSPLCNAAIYMSLIFFLKS